MTWACNQCGACCRGLALGLLAGDGAALHDGDGVCRHLDRETNRCTVYETRPACCRVTPAHDPAELARGCGTLHLAVYGQPWAGAVTR